MKRFTLPLLALLILTGQAAPVATYAALDVQHVKRMDIARQTNGTGYNWRMTACAVPAESPRKPECDDTEGTATGAQLNTLTTVALVKTVMLPKACSERFLPCCPTCVAP